MDILLMDTLIFSRGVKALVSIEYMKMIVEKMSRIVMKQLRAILIIALVSEMLRPLNTMSKSVPTCSIR